MWEGIPLDVWRYLFDMVEGVDFVRIYIYSRLNRFLLSPRDFILRKIRRDIDPYLFTVLPELLESKNLLFVYRQYYGFILSHSGYVPSLFTLSWHSRCSCPVLCSISDMEKRQKEAETSALKIDFYLLKKEPLGVRQLYIKSKIPKMSIHYSPVKNGTRIDIEGFAKRTLNRDPLNLRSVLYADEENWCSFFQLIEEIYSQAGAINYIPKLPSTVLQGIAFNLKGRDFTIFCSLCRATRILYQDETFMKAKILADLLPNLFDFVPYHRLYLIDTYKRFYKIKSSLPMSTANSHYKYELKRRGFYIQITPFIRNSYTCKIHFPDGSYIYQNFYSGEMFIEQRYMKHNIKLISPNYKSTCVNILDVNKFPTNRQLYLYVNKLFLKTVHIFGAYRFEAVNKLTEKLPDGGMIIISRCYSS